MTLFKTLLAASMLSVLSSAAMATDQVAEEEGILEEIPNKKLEKRGERIRGPITAVSAGAMLFATFDTNADYKINSVEIAAGRTQAFNAADKDKSKSLSLFELEDWREAVLGSLDAAPGNLAFDKDFDQRVTRDEFDYALNFAFNAADKNKDNILEFSEMVKVFEMPRRNRLDRDEGSKNRVSRQGQNQGHRPGQGRRR